jgi:hypothetical protein
MRLLLVRWFQVVALQDLRHVGDGLAIPLLVGIPHDAIVLFVSFALAPEDLLDAVHDLAYLIRLEVDGAFGFVRGHGASFSQRE